MAVIGAATAKRIGCLGEQLQHQLFGLHAQSKEHRVVPIICVEVVLGLELKAYCNLNGLVAIGASMDVFGSQLGIFLVEVCHSTACGHEPKA